MCVLKQSGLKSWVRLDLISLAASMLKACYGANKTKLAFKLKAINIQYIKLIKKSC